MTITWTRGTAVGAGCGGPPSMAAWLAGRLPTWLHAASGAPPRAARLAREICGVRTLDAAMPHVRDNTPHQ